MGTAAGPSLIVRAEAGAEKLLARLRADLAALDEPNRSTIAAETLEEGRRRLRLAIADCETVLASLRDAAGRVDSQ